MDKKVIAYSMLIVVGAFVGAVSQVLLKKAAQKKYKSALREYLNGQVIFSYFLLFLTTVFSVIAYKVVPLSFGPILESTSYIYVTVFGVKIFGEKICVKKILALFLILLGICVFALAG